MPAAGASSAPASAGRVPVRVRSSPAGRKHRPGGRCDGRCRPAALASRAAAGPLPPSPGAAAGGRMEQGLSAITLYCAPAAGAMEPEQVSGAAGALRSLRAGGGARAQPLPERGEAAAGPAGRGWWPRPDLPGCVGLGSPRFPAVAAGCSGRAAREEVCLSVRQSAVPSSAL